LATGFVVFALGVFFIGGHQQSSETRQLEEANLKELQQRELKIQTLEEQLKQVRDQLAETNKQMAGLTGKLQQNQKDLSAMQQELASAKREASRLASRLSTPTAQPTARVIDRSPAPPAPVRRAMQPGVYEVIRATVVYEEPSAGARRIAEINRGTKISVVRSVGDWLEVRSRQGNPPGFIRLDDAMFVGRLN
jgi:cell shape-determining protein MreC